MPAEPGELSLAKGIERRKETQLRPLVYRQAGRYGLLPWVPHSGLLGDGVSDLIQPRIGSWPCRMSPGYIGRGA